MASAREIIDAAKASKDITDPEVLWTLLEELADRIDNGPARAAAATSDRLVRDAARGLGSF